MSRQRDSCRIRLDRSTVEIRAHKVGGRLHARWLLGRLMNWMVIGQVCYGSNGEETMHEEHAEGGFK